MKTLTKISLVILAIPFFVFIIFLILLAVINILLDYSVSNNKPENYIAENNKTIIASGMDGYIFKINDNVLFHVLDSNIEIMKTNLSFKNNYSDLIANSETIFSFKNPEESYYLIKDEKFYIKNKYVHKFVDLETFELKDFTDTIEGNWIIFQET